MRIDAHQHFWKFDPVRDAWITEEMQMIRRDFLPADLAPECAANGIAATIAVQADQSEEETLFLLDLAERNALVAGVVGWIDLCSQRVEERLHFFSRHEKLRGLRHVAQAEPDDYFLVRADFLRGVKCLRSFDFTYDILIYPKQLPAAMKLAAALPEQKFVIDHLAKPEIKAGRRKEWEAQMREIAQNPNVYCKVSGMVTEADWSSWKSADFEPYLDTIFEAFGPERLMFGSDWPVCLLAASYTQVVKLVEEYAQANAPAAKKKLFGENATRFYGLKTGQHGHAA
ncbi:MAG: amidohydrolase family protein [Acidobacteria bacterium]|nr:amidohydrolase family protein [Acidobacteriota bacterium]MBS1865181.1 amidohydrolase family protein [Acidobacteriota bacterium]